MARLTDCLGYRHGVLAVCIAVVAAGTATAALVPSAKKIAPIDEQRQASSGYSGKYGNSVALSSDATTALIGGFEDNGGAGSAWFLTRDASGWHQQPKVTTKGTVGAAWFGDSVALSDDGGTALIGAPLDNVSVGSAWVFTHSTSGWTQQAKLIGSAPSSTVQDGFGVDVALSGDGNTALVGAYTYNNTRGAAFTYQRSGDSWVQFGGTLTGAGEKVSAYYGSSVALAADGKTALIGGPSDDEGVGAAWAYARTASGWKQVGAKLLPRGASGHSAFGCSVALSSNGRTALVSGCRDAKGVGAVWIFTRTAHGWSLQGRKLVARGERGKGSFGYSADLSGDGNTAVVGAPDQAAGRGGVWTFVRSHGRWSQQGKDLTGTGEAGAASFGFAVALSRNGKTAIAGGPNDAAGVGAVWPYAEAG
jgi:hypothetical protein